MLTLVGCQDNIYKESLMCHDKAQPLRNKAIFLKKKKRKEKKKRPRYFGHRMVFFLLPASPCESISIYFLIYIYIYNIESVFVKKYFNDHIYLSRHDGFRKRGGESIMGELRGKNRKRRLG